VRSSGSSTRMAPIKAPDVVRFEKWQALGNDYVIVERNALPWELTAERVVRLCSSHFGIGSDGILELAPPSSGNAVAELRIFNPDGSEAELSGNGARQAALYLRTHGWTDGDEFTIATGAGEVRPRITGAGAVSMALGCASLTSPDFPGGQPDGAATIEIDGRAWAFQHVHVGNAQCVVDAGDEVERLDLRRLGRRIETHELFPNRTNVSFVRFDGSEVRARIFERGAGETLASGTGASGAAVAAHLRGASNPITVRMDGGTLEVEVSDALDVLLTGTAEPVYAGELAPELVEALA
jgi:diaminopimelate epimerase